MTSLCDNRAVVAIVNSGQSIMDRVRHLMRSLTFFLARWRVSLSFTYLPGVENGAADALSRNNVSISEAGTNFLRCLVHGTPDWTDVDWISLFSRCS